MNGIATDVVYTTGYRRATIRCYKLLTFTVNTNFCIDSH